jgi:hypothetical protein
MYRSFYLRGDVRQKRICMQDVYSHREIVELLEKNNWLKLSENSDGLSDVYACPSFSQRIEISRVKRKFEREELRELLPRKIYMRLQ